MLSKRFLMSGAAAIAGLATVGQAEAQRDAPPAGAAPGRAAEGQRGAPGPRPGTTPDAQTLARATLRRRAVDAVIWGMPIVSLDAMRQAYFRDAGAKYNDVIWWPNGSGWKNQSLTVNTSVRYMYFFCDTQSDGPVVVELPAGVPAASFYGTIIDAWQEPLVDIGFEGAGGKYLILPPGHTADVPPGYIQVRPNTHGSFTLLRSIIASSSAADVRAGDALVQQVRVYPLARAAAPSAQRFVDMTDILYDGLVRYDETFFARLARVLGEETLQPRDLQMLGMLLPLGIERGKPFTPNAATQAELRAAAAEAQAWMMETRIIFITPWWTGSKWYLPAGPIAPRTEFHWQTPAYFDVDSRGTMFGSIFAPVAKLGSGSFYFGAYHDSSGRRLTGSASYRLRVPANVPASEFWALTIYSQKTGALFRNATRLTVGSLDPEMRRNPDGTTDIYIGPRPPAGREANWLFTPAGEPWFPWFRLYGPERPILDRSWRLPDLERLGDRA